MEKKIKHHTTNIIRIVLYGPESTGKTTLATDLANHYSTSWVPEFARNYLQEKWDLYQKKCSKDDLLFIAQKQLELENQRLINANKLLFCDTNVLVTQLWSEVYFNGYCHPKILQMVKNSNYDLYLLTDIDVPWQADDLRDMPHQRNMLYHHHQKLLHFYGFDYFTISGHPEERLNKAIACIDKKFEL
ncbi:MAG: ATP-binding protein [Flavobacteriaceae bacterium]|nr:ATP-binding protein [Flavobacteriaceae bacterium]MCY4299111.1 ATP-binding protein [Flavobacteriaceae bacterium]